MNDIHSLFHIQQTNLFQGNCSLAAKHRNFSKCHYSANESSRIQMHSSSLRKRTADPLPSLQRIPEANATARGRRYSLSRRCRLVFFFFPEMTDFLANFAGIFANSIFCRNFR